MYDFIRNFSNQWYNINRIEVLSSPQEFFDRIIQNLKSAISVYIITLYIGGPDENSRILFETLKYRKENNLYTKIIIDANRGTEERIMNYINEFDLHDIFIFKNKNKYLPNIISQAIKVLHQKIYIFDNIAILSGGNLGYRYFSKIIDRYYEVESSELTSFLIYKYFNEFVPYEVIESDIKITFTDDDLDTIKYIYKEFKDPIISTAYPNPSNSILKILKNKKIIVPAPDCNTFDDKPFVKNIYSFFVKKLEKQLKILYYNNNKYLYHVKGIWAFNNSFGLTLIGSSNFNKRSQNRDEELNFLIVTKNKKVIEDMKNEVDRFIRDTTDNLEIPVRFYYLKKILLHIFGSFF